MMTNLTTFLSKNRRLLPVSATIFLFFAAYALGAVYLPGMRDPQVFLNLFNQTPYLLISVIGETLVVISGGIDLSVGGVASLTTVASAAWLRVGGNPWEVMACMLAMGIAMGAIMGYFITYLNVQPFIATLAGMWIGRGMAYFISNESVGINNRIYSIIGRTKVLIPGLSNVATQTGDYVTPSVVIAMIVFAVALYASHYTRWGRTIYSMGGASGANEQSARLMGLPVSRTKVSVYTFNGFCSALAGILLSIYAESGQGLLGQGMELTVIAAVVIGGTSLVGGQGYVFGALFGTLITILIQTTIQIQGHLITWWTLIMVGVITLFFIGLQSVIANMRIGGAGGPKMTRAQRLRQVLPYGAGALAIVLAVLAFTILPNVTHGSASAASRGCQLKPFRQQEAASLMKSGAVIAYERNGGVNCIDELYAVYPDGRITGDNTVTQIKKQATPGDVTNLLDFISNQRWFTQNMFSTYHVPCKVCYTYYTSVSYKGQEKTVEAVDGGTDAPSQYWLVTGQFTQFLPPFPSAH